jgi:hypothetical protein
LQAPRVTVLDNEVAGFLAAHDGTRVDGYILGKVPLTKKVAGYKLSYQTEESS